MIIHYTNDFFTNNSFIVTACGELLSPGIRRWSAIKVTNEKTLISCKNCINKLKERKVAK